MFLDIACEFLGRARDWAEPVWTSEDWFAALSIRSLVEKALIRVDGNSCLTMHDHLTDMGREIEKKNRESVCRRLWMPESLTYLVEDKPLPNLLRTLIIYEYPSYNMI